MTNPNIKHNRLINEKSPYLLLHAENPVDWFPWGEEARNKAAAEDKPVFLSIGYSSCHWCHVIAEESFSDPDVAEVLNTGFVPVKVDREERPDVDSVYMTAAQAMTGSGGWPLTILALPDGRPFYAATYLPKMALLHLLNTAARLWKTERKKLTDTAGKIVQALHVLEVTSPPGEPQNLAETALRQLSESYDGRYGGFSEAPKFPSPHNLLFLIDYYRRTKDKRALIMADSTLESMYRGGIFDHIGGGFCRYSTDRRWLVPHFEKMLYDNAMLLWAYAEMYSITGQAPIRFAGESTADYVLREMTGPGGEFYSSQDADSCGGEGGYYTFTPSEIKTALGEEGGNLFCRRFGITKAGNFENKNIPNLIDNDNFASEPDGIPELRRKLYEWRRDRTILRRDDKVLTAWNALMICGLVRASEVFGRGDYLEAATKSADFILKNLTGPAGRLYIRWREGEAKGEGTAEDYAFFSLALLMLGRTAEAAKLADILLLHFTDSDTGGLYLYADDAEPLFLRPKETYDGAMPSGNSAFLEVLARLYKATGEGRWRAALQKHLTYMCSAAARYPAGSTFALRLNALSGAGVFEGSLV